MNANEQTISRFYAAFSTLDPDTMAACYAPEVEFSDEVFALSGREQTMSMWRMLCEGVRAKGMGTWKLEFSQIQATGDQGQAHWDATYLFSATGRVVHNRIDARFRFNPAGLIVDHRDRFDFWAWSRQALGTPGVLLGWTPLLRNKVRAQAGANLRKFNERQGAASGVIR